MRGIRSDAIMDTFSGVVYDSWGAKEAPPPYGLWFDGAWDKPRLTDPAVCAGMTDYAKMLATGPANKFAIDWPDANTLFSQGKAAFFIDASLFGPSYEDATQSQVAGKVGYRRCRRPRPRAVVHRPLAVGPRHPEERSEQGRRLVLHPVDDEQGEHGQDRGYDRRGAAAVVVLGSGLTGKLVPEYVTAVNEAMKTSRTTVVFKDEWKDGALAIVDGMLAIANGADPTAACAKANDALLKAVNK